MSKLGGEYDYIGLSELPPLEASDRNGEHGLNLKATELRLGLPGSESPDRVDPGFLSLKSGHAMSGAKRGFSDAIKASGKWVFSSGSDSGQVVANLTDKQETRLAPPVPADKKASGALGASHASKAQVVGWPPVRSFRKNTMASHSQKKGDEEDAKSGAGCLFVKVSMKGAPYLRKIDLNNYKSYTELSSALEKMFSCFTIGQCSSHGGSGNDGFNKGGLTNLLQGSECVLTYEDKDGDWMLVGDVPWPMFKDTCTKLRIMKSSEAIGLAPRGVDKCKSRN